MKLLQQGILLAAVLFPLLPAFSQGEIFVELYLQVSIDKYPKDSNIFRLLGTGTMTGRRSGTNIFIYPEEFLRFVSRTEPEESTLYVWNKTLFPPANEATKLQKHAVSSCNFLTATPALQGSNLFFVLLDRTVKNLRYVRRSMQHREDTGETELQLTLTDIEWCPEDKENPYQNGRVSDFFLSSMPDMALSQLIDKLLTGEVNLLCDAKIYDDIFFVPPDSGIQLYIIYRQKLRRKVVVWIVMPDAQQFLAIFGQPRAHRVSSNESSRSTTPETPYPAPLERRRGSGGSLLRGLLKDKIGQVSSRSRRNSISEEVEK